MKKISPLLFIYLILCSSNAVAQFVPPAFPNVVPPSGSGYSLAKWRAGYFYYNKDGKKTEGLLTLVVNDFDKKIKGAWAVMYKQSKRGEKTKYTTQDICCFVIKEDSFAVIKNITARVDDGLITPPTYAMDFAKVVETGKINLYEYSGEWVIEKDGGQAEYLTQLHFDVQMAKYIADYPVLLHKLQSHQLEYTNAKDDTRAIIKYYNEYARVNLK